MGWLNWFKKEEPVEVVHSPLWYVIEMNAFRHHRGRFNFFSESKVSSLEESFITAGIDTVEKAEKKFAEEEVTFLKNQEREVLYEELQQKRKDDEIDEYILWKNNQKQKED